MDSDTSPIEESFRRDHYLSFQVTMLKCLGMWPLNFKRFLPYKLHILLNALFYCVMSGNLLQMAVFQMKTLYEAWDGSRMDDVSDFIISSIIYSAGLMMCLYFQVRYRSNKRMVDHLNRTLVSRSGRGLTYVTITRCHEWARKLSIWWTVGCVLGTIHYGIVPLLIWKRMLPVNIKYPFDTESSPGFEIMYCVQFIGQLQIGAIYSIYGAEWMSVIILICGQFDVLYCSIKNALWTGMLQRGSAADIEFLKERQTAGTVTDTIKYYNSVEVEEDLNGVRAPLTDQKDVPLQLFGGYEREILFELRKAVLLHQNILRLSAMLEEFFYPFMLGKIFVCSLLACFLAYLSSSDLSMMKVITLVEYLLLVFAELLLITYFPAVLLDQVGGKRVKVDK